MLLLAIEVLDEFVFGTGEAAWPAIRHDLHVSYAVIGLLLSVPRFVAAVVEPVAGLLADMGRRRCLVVAGGCLFAAALGGIALAPVWWVLLLAFVVLYPASGAFVGLAQATLMDLQPARREFNMVRWTLAGSIGVVFGPLALSAIYLLGGGWRPMYLVLALAAVPLALFARSIPESLPVDRSVLEGLRVALGGLRCWRLVRWLLMLEAGDLMGDILTGYVALYLVDVAHGSAVQGALAVAVLTGAGLAGDALLLPVLRRISSMTYLRASSLLMVPVYPAFLLLPGFAWRLVPLIPIGLLRAGWYAISQARLYDELPEASGSILVFSNAGALASGAFLFAFGLAAERWGFGPTMWVLLLGPVTVLVLMRQVPVERAPDDEVPTTLHT